MQSPRPNLPPPASRASAAQASARALARSHHGAVPTRTAPLNPSYCTKRRAQPIKPHVTHKKMDPQAHLFNVSHKAGKSRLYLPRGIRIVGDDVPLRHKLGEPTSVFEGVRIAFPVQESSGVEEAGKGAEDTHLYEVGSYRGRGGRLLPASRGDFAANGAVCRKSLLKTGGAVIRQYFCCKSDSLQQNHSCPPAPSAARRAASRRCERVRLMESAGGSSGKATRLVWVSSQIAQTSSASSSRSSAGIMP